MFHKIIYFLVAKPIRYIALKLMKRLRQPNDGRAIIAASNHILEEMVFPSVFAVFQDKKFREWMKFSSLSDDRQNIIFNELQAAGVCLALFCLQSADAIVKPESQHFWIKTREHFLKQVQIELIKLGLNGSNAKMFCQVAEQRFKEYEKLADEVRSIWMEEEPSFRKMPDDAKYLVCRMDALVMGTADHMYHGKIDNADNRLIKFLREEFYGLNERIGKFIKHL